MTDAQGTTDARAGADAGARKGPLRLLQLTLDKAWQCNIFSESAEAAFWSTLSLPPLLLGLLGSLGFIGDVLGPGVVGEVHDKILAFSEKLFSSTVVTQIIGPTVNDILTIGKGEVVSVGFVISLWAGSSAMASYVDAVTVAHGQYGVRNEVWQRFFALLLYMASLVLLIVGLPLIAVGPDLLPEFVPSALRPTVAGWVGALYYPALAVLIVLGTATLYKVALPRKLPWHRGLPGAVLAMGIFLVTSVGLRIYISWITTTGYTYGALATPIAWLLFMYFVGMAVAGGAYFNAAIQELWPAKMTRRERRKWRRLDLERAAEEVAGDTADGVLEETGSGGDDAAEPAAPARPSRRPPAPHPTRAGEGTPADGGERPDGRQAGEPTDRPVDGPMPGTDGAPPATAR